VDRVRAGRGAWVRRCDLTHGDTCSILLKTACP
jgi:hypothetical protein